MLSPVRAFVALPLLSTVSLFAFQQVDRPLAALNDPLIRNEIAQLGPYAEMAMPASLGDLRELPLRNGSSLLAEFAGEGIRVRLEAQPFPRPEFVQRKGRFMLEGMPIHGWTIGTQHNRMSRVELVLDGVVTEVPETAFTDLFDVRLCEDGPSGPLHFALAARSVDGWRTYVLVQAGQGKEACLVTWVFEDGKYLYRMVDTFRTNG